MKVTICDRCGDRVSGKPYKILIGRYNGNSRLLPEEFSKGIKEYDLCENCAKEISKFVRNKPSRAAVDESLTRTTDTLVVPAGASVREKQELSKKKKSTKRRDIDINDIIVLRNEGVSYKEIAKELDCSEGTIYNRIKKYEEFQKKVAALDKGKILALWKTGKWSVKDIAAEMKTSADLIREVLAR